MIIIQVTNEVFIVFLTQEILLAANNFSVSITFKKDRLFIARKFIFSNFNITKS